MILRAITETCNVKKCHNIIKSLFHTKGKYEEEHILPLLRINSFILNLLYCTCNNTRVLLWTDLRTHIDLKTLHLHNIPIRNPRKFHSLTLTSSKKFSLPRRFFHLLHPADMHATSLGHIWFVIFIIWMFKNPICERERKREINPNKNRTHCKLINVAEILQGRDNVRTFR